MDDTSNQNEKQRNEKGQYTAEHSVTVEDVFEEMEPLEPYTTREIADDLSIPRRTAYEFLEELAEGDRIRKKKPELRRVIWIRERS